MSPNYSDAEALRDGMARAVCPDAWAEYDAGNGVCDMQSGLRVLESISAASRIYRYLFERGVDLPEPPRNP